MKSSYTKKPTPMLDEVTPLIVVGMHRSGTSLLSRLLDDLGIHMGLWQSRDAEAVYFQKMNRRIYAEVDATWAEPEAIISATRSSEFVQKHSDEIIRKFDGSRPVIGRYFSTLNWKEKIQEPNFFWGWKDPRTALVIPIWNQVFPKARWVHIIRNGIDVATSLYQRAYRQQDKWIRKFSNFDFSERTLNFNYDFHLWELYLESITQALEKINSDQTLQIYYEDLLQEPEKTVSSVLNFIKFQTTTEKIKRVCMQIDMNKINNSRAREKHKNLISALPTSNWMDDLGYLDQRVI